MTAGEQEELLQVLNNHRRCFAVSLNKLGCTTIDEMDIVLKEGSRPFAAKPYRTSRVEREEITRHVDTWRSHCIVEDSNSPHAAPVLLVRKKNGESRMVVDYRRLNANTVRQPYPLPNVDDLLELFSECTLFSVLYLAHGFLQIPLTNRAKEHTAFITPDGTGQFTRWCLA